MTKAFPVWSQMQSGNDWLIDGWMNDMKDATAEWVNGLRDWFVAATSWVAYECKMCAWLMSSSLSSLRWQAQLQAKAPRQRPVATAAAAAAAVAVWHEAKNAHGDCRCQAQSQSPRTQIGNVLLLPLTLTLAACHTAPHWFSGTLLVAGFCLMKNEVQSKAPGKTKSNILLCSAQKKKKQNKKRTNAKRENS